MVIHNLDFGLGCHVGHCESVSLGIYPVVELFMNLMGLCDLEKKLQNICNNLLTG